MGTRYPNGWEPRYAAYDVTEARVCGGVIRLREPRRTPEEEAAFRRGVDAAIRTACLGWKMSATKAARTRNPDGA